MNVFKKFFLKVKKFFSIFTRRKNHNPTGSQSTSPSQSGEPASSQSAAPSHNDGPFLSQSTVPSHNDNESSALSTAISIVNAINNVADGIGISGLSMAIGGLLKVLESIKVC